MRTVQYALVLVLLTVLWTSAGSAMGKRNPDGLVSLTGTIRVTGNMPFARVVLVPQGEDPDRATKDRIYLVTGDKARELMDRYQGKTVTLLGPPCASPSPEYQKCIAPVEIRQEAPTLP